MTSLYDQEHYNFSTLIPGLNVCNVLFNHSLITEVYFHALVFVLVVLGKMRSAVGSAQLLISQKFQQFRELCEENLVSFTVSHKTWNYFFVTVFDQLTCGRFILYFKLPHPSMSCCIFLIIRFQLWNLKHLLFSKQNQMIYYLQMQRHKWTVNITVKTLRLSRVLSYWIL